MTRFRTLKRAADGVESSGWLCLVRGAAMRRFLGLVVLLGCGGGGGSVIVTGAAMKGPLISGSAITVHMIDTSAHPTGTNYNTVTTSDRGEFNLTVAQGGQAELQADGFYFNETSGSLSGSRITLYALAPIATGTGLQIYVNAYTHMAEARAKTLMTDQTSLSAAVAQAEGELRTGLGLFVPGSTGAGTSLNILGGDSDANAYLFALSCTLGQAAENAGAGSIDANLQQLINNVALDLSDDGMLNNGAFALATKIAAGRRYMDPMSCAANMQARLTQTGSSTTLPALARALDFDGDGVADATDTDADGDGIPAASDTMADVAEGPGGTFAIETSGQVWAWNTTFGESQRHSNPLPVAGLSSVAQIASTAGGGGVMVTYAIKTDGTMWSWGATPVAVNGAAGLRSTPNDMATYGGGTDGVMAVKTDGTLIDVSGGVTAAVTGITNVTAIVGPPRGDPMQFFIAQLTDGTVELIPGFPKFFGSGVISVTGVTGVTGTRAITTDGKNGYAVSGGQVYHFTIPSFCSPTGNTCPSSVAATAISGLSGITAVGGRGSFAVDGSHTLWWFGGDVTPVAGATGVAYPTQTNLLIMIDGTVALADAHGATVTPIPIPR